MSLWLLGVGLADAVEPVEFAGVWALAIASGDRTVERRLELVRDEQGWSGTLDLGAEALPLESIVVRENLLISELSQSTPRGERRLRLEARLEGERLIGELTGIYGKSSFTGHKGETVEASRERTRHPPPLRRFQRDRSGSDAKATAVPAVTPSTATGFPPAPGSLTFRANNAIYAAVGRFDRWRFLEVSLPDGDFTRGRVVIEIELDSVRERTSALADHLRGVDFFDVASHPVAVVTISAARRGEGGAYQASAEVDLHGVKGLVPISFTVEEADPSRISGRAVLSRTRFGVGQPVVAGSDTSVADEVVIELTATLPLAPSPTRGD